MANKIAFADIQQVASSKAGQQAIKDKVDEILSGFTPDDPPYLSDVLAARATGGTWIQEELGKRAEKRGGNKFRWRIRCLVHQYGQQPKPGDVIKRKRREGDKLYDAKEYLWTSREMNEAKLQGTYSEKFEEADEYILDDKGCFECGFEDAVYFIFSKGVHGRTLKPVNPQNSKQFHDEPVNVPFDMRDELGKEKAHIHYWNFTEVDNEQYESLPSLTKAKTKNKSSQTTL